MLATQQRLLHLEKKKKTKSQTSEKERERLQAYLFCKQEEELGGGQAVCQAMLLVTDPSTLEAHGFMTDAKGGWNPFRVGMMAGALQEAMFHLAAFPHTANSVSPSVAGTETCLLGLVTCLFLILEASPISWRGTAVVAQQASPWNRC